MTNSERFTAFIDGLTDEEFARVLGKLRRYAQVWPMTPQQEVAAGVGAVLAARPHTPEELALLEAHARALLAREEAATAYQQAAAALDAARRRKAPAEELARLSEAYDSAAGALEAANAAEVAARPANARRRQPIRRPLLRRLGIGG